LKFVKAKIKSFFSFLLLYSVIINLIIFSTSHPINRIQYINQIFSPHTANTGIGISYSPEIEHLVVCQGQFINGSQNTIRIYNTGDEDLIISIGFQKSGITFSPNQNNFLLEKGTNQAVDFSINITDPAITGISSINILGLSGEQAGNPVVTSAKINILFEILETRKITFIVKNNITDEIIPNVEVVIHRLMDTNNYLEYTSEFTHNGSGFFLVAAGIYKLEVYQEAVLIGQKIVTVTSEDIEIVIYCEPIPEGLDFTWFFVLIIIIIGSFAGIFAYILIQKRRKQKKINLNE